MHFGDSLHIILYDWWVGHELSILRKTTFRNKNTKEIQSDFTNMYMTQDACSDTHTVYPSCELIICFDTENCKKRHWFQYSVLSLLIIM